MLILASIPVISASKLFYDLRSEQFARREVAIGNGLRNPVLSNRELLGLIPQQSDRMLFREFRPPSFDRALEKKIREKQIIIFFYRLLSPFKEMAHM
jgi:hypothetical protein